MKQKRLDVCITSIDWITHPNPLAYKSKSEIAKYAAFFLGAELNRHSYFHSMLTTRARRWASENNQFREINAFRLFVKDIFGETRYIDVISENYCDNYIRQLCRSANKSAASLIS